MTTSDFHELEDVLDFTESDLSANREGSMSGRQLKALRRKRFGMSISLVFEFLFAVVIAAIPVIFLLLALTSPFRSLGNFLLLLPAILLTGGLAALFSYFLITQRRQRWLAYGDDLKEGIVNRTTGQLTKATFVRSRQRFWMISVGNEQLKINQKIFPCFEQYGFYHVYFTPHTCIILSAEFSQDTN